MDDAELREWFGGVFTTVSKGLGLPQWAEQMVEQGLRLVPPGTLLDLAEKLGLASAEEVRQLARSAPDLAARLAADEGQRAIGEWEARHDTVPFLRATKGAFSSIRSLSHSDDSADRAAMCRGVTAIVVGCLGEETRITRSQLADAMGSEESSVSLMRKYRDLMANGDRESMERVNSTICQVPVISETAWEAMLRALRSQRPVTVWEFGHEQSEGQLPAEIRGWLFGRR